LLAPPAPAAPAPPSPYDQALALEAKGDFAAAAEQLSRAADLEPARGELALYSLGRLAQRQLHDPTRALTAFHLCHQRFPQGALAPEVDLSILELNVAAHHPDAALAASDRFLADHPDSERSDEVHLLRGGLLRDRGDCHRALADYQAVRGPALAEDALFSTAYCQEKLGDKPAARRTMSTYLERYPHGRHRAEVEKALAVEPDKSF
jgi:outer membrane protein assembly factor BamD (BamD/ComL family)